MKKNWSLLFCSGCLTIALSIYGCSEKKHNINSLPAALPAVDTYDAAATYKKFSGLTASTVDTVYRRFLAACYGYRTYDVMYQHALVYSRLAGNRTYAKATAAKYMGIVYNHLAKFDSSAYFFNKAIQWYDQLNLQAELADCYYGAAANHFDKGDYAGAFTYNYAALHIYESLRDSAGIYRLKTEIGDDYLHNRQYDSAISILQVCYRYYHQRRRPANEGYILSLLSQAYGAKGDSGKSIAFQLAALATSRSIGDQHGIAASLNNLSAKYMEEKQWDKALTGFKESLGILIGLNEERQMPIVKENIANCLWHMGKNDEAGKMLLEIIADAKDKKRQSVIAHSYEILSHVRYDQHDYKAALRYYVLYSAYKDSIFNKDKEQIISELNVKYKSAQKDAAIFKLNTERKRNAAIRIIYFFITIIALLITALSVVVLRNRNRKNKLLVEKMQLVLEMNKKELHQFTESLINKNRMIEDLQMKLESKMAVLELHENNSQLSELYQQKILTDDDWRQFKILFDKVYPGLINRLRMQYPELSQAEERQFLLIKLRINNKESADMLGISPVSIKKNRYRLKKRFKLCEQDDLDAFVEGFK